MPLTIATASRRLASPRASRLQGSTGRTDHGPGAHPRTRHDLCRDGQLHRMQIENWLKLNAKYVSASVRPNITAKPQPPADAKELDGVEDKVEKYFLAKARSGRLNIRSDCTICTIRGTSYPCSGWGEVAKSNKIAVQRKPMSGYNLSSRHQRREADPAAARHGSSCQLARRRQPGTHDTRPLD